jgi:hypothetical protein
VNCWFLRAAWAEMAGQPLTFAYQSLIFLKAEARKNEKSHL